MQGKDTITSTFHQLFQLVLDAGFQEKLTGLGVDKYAKKLKTVQLIILMAYAQLEQQQGLRDISNSLNDVELSNALDLDSISASQISRRLQNLSPIALRMLFRRAVWEISKDIGNDAITRELGRLNLIDSTIISLCLTQNRWAAFQQTKAGIKVHLGLRFWENGVLPENALITPARLADKTQMDALLLEENDVVNVFDRGYVDYRKFDTYCERDIRFVTRLKGNAIVEVATELPVDPTGPIKKEQIVYLGKEGPNKMRHPLRLLETTDSEGKRVIIITNDFKLKAIEIADIYRYRWQIELFFKWIKQHLRVKRFYGLSQQAVENQIFIALITYCLLALLKLKMGYKGPLLSIQRLIHACLYEPFTSLVQRLYHKQRTSKGRRKMNHEEIYQMTVEQVLAGETDHLDDLTYDPVVL